MKARNGFVSNSSTSSFILVFNKKIKEENIEVSFHGFFKEELDFSTHFINHIQDFLNLTYDKCLNYKILMKIFPFIEENLKTLLNEKTLVYIEVDEILPSEYIELKFNNENNIDYKILTIDSEI